MGEVLAKDIEVPELTPVFGVNSWQDKPGVENASASFPTDISRAKPASLDMILQLPLLNLPRSEVN